MIRYFMLTGMCMLLLFASCSTERKLARKYVKHHSGNGIMIVPLYELYKDNLSIRYDTAIKYSPDQFDSMAWVQSNYVQYVSDSVFLSTFTNNLIESLTKQGFDVYVEGSSDVFLALPDPKWVIQISQMQLNEEYRYDTYDMFSIESERYYTSDVRINKINLSTWLEVSRANSGNKQILYLESYMEDEMDHGVIWNTAKLDSGLEKKRDSIQLKDIYTMAFDSGVKHGELLFDYFMNDYIRDHLPTHIADRLYFHFNQESRSLTRGLKERFDVVID